jgi:hypothetical protein
MSGSNFKEESNNMKSLTLKTLLALSAATLFAACSSMEPEGLSETYGNQLPSDFQVAEFDKLNPDIRLAQLKLPFRDSNAVWAQKVAAEGRDTTAEMKAQNALFIGALGLDSAIEPSIGAQLAREFLFWPDSLLVEAQANVNVSSKPNSYNKLIAYNLYDDRYNEIELVKNFAVDSLALIQTYILYGKAEGRAYRQCTQAEIEAAHPWVADASVPICADTEKGIPYPRYSTVDPTKE